MLKLHTELEFPKRGIVQIIEFKIIKILNRLGGFYGFTSEPEKLNS